MDLPDAAVPPSRPRFLTGGGEMSDLLRAHDWSASPVGPLENWSLPLKTLVSVMLASNQPMFIAWGPERTLLYNDAYIGIIASKHPSALGRDILEVWHEIPEFLGPVVADAYAGRPVHMGDVELTVERKGYPEKAHFAFSFTPVRDEGERIAGFFCAATETTRQVLVERQRAADAERQRRLFEQAPGFITILSGAELRFEFVNQAYERLFGHRGFVGKTVREIFPDLAGQPFFDLLDNAYATGERFVARVIPIRLQTTPEAEPTERFLDFIYEPVRDEDGAVTGLFIEGYDVTDAHVGQEALRESEARYRSLFDAIDAGFCVIEVIFDECGEATDYRFVETNPAFERQSGLAGVVGRRVREFTPALEEVWFERYGRVALTGESFRVEDESAALGRWFDINAFRTGAPEQRRVAVLFNDITARRNTEERLRELNETLEQEVNERTAERDRMWETSPDLMLVIDFDGVFRRVSPAWTTMLGYAPEELVGHHVNEFVVPDDHDETTDAYESAAAGGRPAIVNRYRHKDGSIRRISWVAAPAGGMTYATGRDITLEKEREAELAQAQEALRQSQKMEAVGQLTGGVAHDFNNLLTVIRGSVELLRRPNLSEERRTRYIDAISDTSTRATKLTSQLLAFARRQALKPEVFNTVSSIGAVTSMVQTMTGSRIQIATTFASEPCWVNADPSQFDTALVNMAVNARDAMSGEGRLTIEVRPAPGIPAVRGHPPVDGPFVAVSLSDTGAGIPADRLESIFEPFFTTKAVGQGTGLGLSQVFGFVKQSGGEVEVTSEEGRGTTFTLYLPRVDAPEWTDVAADLSNELIDGQGACVLVVEDNADVGAFATQALAELGYQTVLAVDAEAALAELQHDSDRFDVVFSDVVMPGMNGVELGQEIRRRHQHLPVLLTSGYSHVLAQNGTHGFELLHKPYSIEQLSRVLRKASMWRKRKSLGSAD